MSRTFRWLVPVAALAAGVAAYYGGWATVTVENLPDHLVAGTPYNMTFSIRQHGRDLLDELTPSVALVSGERSATARAVPTNRRGYYTATLNVPQTGAWTATIHTSFGKSQLKLMPIPVIAAGAQPAARYSESDRGHRLFVAKGCVACHEHARVAESGTYKVGPILTGKRFETDYLRRFLADPSVKPPTVDARMPDLNLSDADISALVAFINGAAAPRAAKGGE